MKGRGPRPSVRSQLPSPQCDARHAHITSDSGIGRWVCTVSGRGPADHGGSSPGHRSRTCVLSLLRAEPWAGSMLLQWSAPAQGACSSGALKPWPEERGCWRSHWVKDRFLGDRGQRADATPRNINEAVQCLSAASGQCERPSQGPVFQAGSKTDNRCFLVGLETTASCQGPSTSHKAHLSG